MGRRLALPLTLAALLAGCGQSAPGPVEIIQDYMSAIVDGNFAEACSYLDAAARGSLSATLRSDAVCPTLLVRCFPNRSTVLAKDQTQLLYGTVQVRQHRTRASAQTSGTEVADRIQQLTLAEKRGTWLLASYGKERCEPFRRTS